MSKMKELLLEKLNQWEKDIGAHPQLQLKENQVLTVTKRQLFKPTNNISRATFEAVRMHHGTDRKSITKILVNKGYSVNSVSSILTQMIRQEIVRAVNKDGFSYLYPNVPAYKPLKAYKTYKRQEQKKTQPALKAQKKDVGIAALPAAATAPVVQINSSWDASTIIDHLSLRQARALYDELTKVFGGK